MKNHWLCWQILGLKIHYQTEKVSTKFDGKTGIICGKMCDNVHLICLSKLKYVGKNKNKTNIT